MSADPGDEAAEARDAAVRLRETTARILADQAAVAVNEALDFIGASTPQRDTDAFPELLARRDA